MQLPDVTDVEWHQDGWGGHFALWVKEGVGTGTGLEDVLWGPVKCSVCDQVFDDQDKFE